MKNIDITKSVMQKVAEFERRKIRMWIMGFVSTVGLFLIVLCGSVWLAAKQIMERQSLELLSLFREDPEIIGEFWRDTLDIFWEEFPKRAAIVSIVAFIALIIMLFFTARSRRIMQKKLKQLDKMK